MVTATGAEILSRSLMKAEFSQDVFAESSVPGQPASATAQLQETMHGFHTPRAKRLKHKRGLRTSNTKEETDNAILRYISMSEQNEESDIASATSTAAKDDYIWEKKRMAVEAFDVTMVASMSDAVDRSLKNGKLHYKISPIWPPTRYLESIPFTLLLMPQSSYTRQRLTPYLPRQTKFN
ncbi:hypothetical protein MHU86_23620 [Fragilaria crotonensis]|nr:hypothetical protein MHU86_23620 [Fragilaria crotonensis]